MVRPLQSLLRRPLHIQPEFFHSQSTNKTPLRLFCKFCRRYEHRLISRLTHGSFRDMFSNWAFRSMSPMRLESSLLPQSPNFDRSTSCAFTPRIIRLFLTDHIVWCVHRSLWSVRHNSFMANFPSCIVSYVTINTLRSWRAS